MSTRSAAAMIWRVLARRSRSSTARRSRASAVDESCAASRAALASSRRRLASSSWWYQCDSSRTTRDDGATVRGDGAMKRGARMRSTCARSPHVVARAAPAGRTDWSTRRTTPTRGSKASCAPAAAISACSWSDSNSRTLRCISPSSSARAFAPCTSASAAANSRHTRSARRTPLGASPLGRPPYVERRSASE